jgi:hypothetical protein
MSRLLAVGLVTLEIVNGSADGVPGLFVVAAMLFLLSPPNADPSPAGRIGWCGNRSCKGGFFPFGSEYSPAPRVSTTGGGIPIDKERIGREKEVGHDTSVVSHRLRIKGTTFLWVDPMVSTNKARNPNIEIRIE